ncbi:MAG TPA: zinc dependent phospholipase C family protein [Polyangiales bacterium]
MPAEAIHLSVFQDSLARSRAAAHTGTTELFALGRLGAVAIDLPYFDKFPISVARYLLRMTTATSAWGNLFHERSPVQIAKLLLRSARALRAQRHTREAGGRVQAFALGFTSHIAVDRFMHPLVNRLARARAQRLSDHWLRQHTEVEKFQSVLFHEERNGFDFMGRRELAQHIAVEGQRLVRDETLSRAFRHALGGALGAAPELALIQRWVRGYAQYTRLVSSPLGKTMMPEQVKHEVRDEVYAGEVRFGDEYARAVALSTEALDLALGYAQGEVSDQVFDAALPEGSIDE